MNPFQANNLLYTYPPENLSRNSKPQMSSLSKRFKRLASLNPFKFRDRSPPQSQFISSSLSCMCFYIRRPPKTLHSTFFRLPHIKIKNAPEDKVKCEVNSGQCKVHVVAQNSTK